MSGEAHYRKLERLYLSAPTNEYYRPSIRVERGRAEIEIAVKQDFFHAAHAVHGSVYFKALDDAAFFAVNSLVERVFVLTASFTVHLLRPVSEGVLRATGHVVHRSRRVYVAESELTDDEGEQVARGSGIFMRSRIALGPEVGYR
ncbi:MAG: PaaI family thioesterase [Gemmatimonadetes bacterium]|uniref:PaaI family thioesterase n=1 Tax=Candidatus Kutchimonas denitrificans TaxID=3056748 RepID=A0AAE4Z581_9BACT|nr:PaaI family thioesterase [Gemmatimonadota bacterium]NIR73564.1 PaaI family thioesterase [Candidatus Kutchimonas denitrificans]NIR99523.1 PaaI family thioesterase [Gemmatimonadota bacterium]NIT65143.1 PaaI family thioesterase [Gemmatimonadota bacterium]NIV23676.1 hotdog fold thioesterase [Gemmatimonadota bacterium]